MKHTGSLLIVDDNPDILIAARLLLKQHYQSVKTTDNPFEIAGIINEQRKADQPIDVILLDMNFTQDSISGKEGFYWLKKIIEQDANIVVLLMTAYGDIQLAVDAIKAGASDFIAKPWRNDTLLQSIQTTLQLNSFSQSCTNCKVSSLSRPVFTNTIIKSYSSDLFLSNQ